MPVCNYTTSVPANRSIAEIQDALVKHGATGVLCKYEQGTGRIEALQFLLRIKNQDVAFSLPVRWQRFQRVLELQDIARGQAPCSFSLLLQELWCVCPHDIRGSTE
jgi:hypothetical protein